MHGEEPTPLFCRSCYVMFLDFAGEMGTVIVSTSSVVLPSQLRKYPRVDKPAAPSFMPQHPWACLSCTVSKT